MNLDHRAVLIYIASTLLAPIAAGAEPRLPPSPAVLPDAGAPQPVSPAGRVELACPTFSWSAVAGAPGYELVVYRVGQDGEVGEKPLVSMRLPAGTSSWTPPGADCFAARGRFAWSLRVVGEGGEAAWPTPLLFEVAADPSVAEVKAALATLRGYLARSREDVTDRRALEELAPGRPPAGTSPRSIALAAPSRRKPDGSAADAAGGTSRPPGALAAKAAPSLGTASLTLDGDVALGSASNLFKDGGVFLWDDTVGNTALGRLALASAAGTATHNTAVGTEALGGIVGGSLNTALGSRALLSNTSGHRNTAGGAFSLQYNTLGAYNTAWGVFALRENVTGSRNTAIGYKALRNGTGDGNVALGFNAGIHATDGDDNIFIGNGGGSEDSGTIRIGAFQTRAFIAGIHGESVAGSLNEMTVLVDSSGKLGTQTSSRRFKEGIATVGETSRALLELRPVRFRYKEQEGGGPEQFGLVAEEVAEVFPDLVVRDAEGRPLSVRYHALAPLLLAELQRAYREIEAVRTDLADHRGQLESLRKRLAVPEPAPGSAASPPVQPVVTSGGPEGTATAGRESGRSRRP